MKILDLRSGRLTEVGRNYSPRTVRVISGSEAYPEGDRYEIEASIHKRNDMEYRRENERNKENERHFLDKKKMPYMREDGHVMSKSDSKPEDSAYWRYIDVYGYHFSKELAETAVSWLKNADKSSRIWRLSEIKDMFTRLGIKKPEDATWGDVHYIFAMCYADGFPKVYKSDSDLVKATMMHLEDPDAPEGAEFVKWLAVQKHMGHEIKWAEMM